MPTLVVGMPCVSSIHVMFPAAETAEKTCGVWSLRSSSPDLSCPRKRGHGTRLTHSAGRFGEVFENGQGVAVFL